MKTDSLFYQLFKQSPKLVFELAGIDQSDEEGYEFRAEEIKQTAFRLDGVLTPPLELKNLPLVFVEVQFQPDYDFYSRFFCEIFLYLHQNKPDHPWIAAVIYPSRKIETSGELHYSLLLESRQVHRIYLDELVNQPSKNARVRLVQLIVEDSKRGLESARTLIEEIENGKLVVDNKAKILELIETIVVCKYPEISREELKKMLGYNDISIKQTRFYQEVYAEGEVNLIIRILARRFGELSGDTLKIIKSLTINQLDELGEKLLDFVTLNDLEKWLEK